MSASSRDDYLSPALVLLALLEKVVMQEDRRILLHRHLLGRSGWRLKALQPYVL